MKSRVIALWSAVALAAGTTFASTPSVVSLPYPEKASVDLAFAKTAAAPDKASISGSVRYENGQAQVTVKYSGMEPAILFGGDIAAYVVWAVQKSAAPENLGELVVTKKGASGKQVYTTGKKDFAIMITAEPYYVVARPFELVIATSAPKDTKKYQGTSWVFQDFRPGPVAGHQSIAGMSYTDKAPVPVKQAESALNLVKRLNAGDVNPDAVQKATVALGEAQAAKSSTAVTDAARRSISSSALALRDWAHTRDELAASQAAAKTAAEKTALEQKNAATQQKLSTSEAEKSAIAVQRDQLAKERDQLTKDQAALTAERDALAAKLSNALGAVAETKTTARGTVTSLSGVLFDTGKATLKPEAKLTLAKLAGVMLVFSKTSMSVEGYTDNVGSDATNMKLSTDRAKAVRDFFEGQGIQSNRLTYVGKGPADPVAPNDTPDGRSKNRRVEIVSSEPQL
ncbi:MAG TPA: OmpA family protein [Candidatus Polarisedimenticolaceae bacterium]|nr:OmpA family protein [Candidatus Polarisedimenticolaceae bacterium]